MISKICSPSFAFVKENADMIDQLSLVTLNTAILAGEIFSSIPVEIPRVARGLLAFTGVISIEFQFQEAWKSLRDFHYSVHWDEVTYTALRVTLKATDIFLTIGSFTAASLSIIGYPGLSAIYYSYVTPFATASWLLFLTFELIDTVQTKALLQKLHSVPEEKKEEIVSSFNRLLQEDSQNSHEMARKLLKQFDIYRLKELQKKEITFDDLQKNLQTRLIITHADLGLQVVGYISLGINRMYPESLIQAMTAWGISVLYTAKLAYNKYSSSPRIN